MPHFRPYHTIDRSATPVWSALDIASHQTTRARTSALVTWLRCPQCHCGYFLAGAPSPQPCPACSGGRLQPVALWDLRTEAAPPGLLVAREVRP